jgi:tetratricopeptide (TPR) repeat protein
MKPEEIEKLLQTDTEISPREKQLRAEQQQVQREQLEKALEQASSKAAELERKLTVKSIAPEPYSQEQKITTAAGEPETSQKEKKIEKEAPTLMKVTPLEPEKQMDVYERMKQQLDQIQKQVQTIQSAPDLEKGDEAKGDKVTEGKEKEADTAKKEHSFEKLSRDEISNRAKTILEGYKSFAAYSEDKFNQYMRAGETYLKEGRYYLAASAYTIASVHKPGDPLPLAGKSHALFAAGEYMSSALYLTRAIEIFPQYAQFRVDIVAMLGDKDKVENRIADIQDCLKITDAPELRFLLAYVYYQMGRFNEAKKSIDAAYKEMSDAPAVAALKEAIDASVR